MNWLKNIAIRSKILFISSVGIVAFLIYLSFNYYVSYENTKQLNQLKSTSLDALSNIDKLISSTHGIKTLFQDAASMGETETIDEAMMLSSTVFSNLKTIKQQSPINSQLIDIINKQLKTYLDSAKFVTNKMISGDVDDAGFQEQLAAMNKATNELEKHFKKLKTSAYDDTINNINQVISYTKNAIITGFIIGIALVSLITFISIILINAMKGNKIALDVANKISDNINNNTDSGNLADDIIVDSKDEIGQLLQAMKKMLHGLQNKIKSDRIVSEENSRIRNALDNASSCTMLIDPDNTITYINKSMTLLLNSLREHNNINKHDSYVNNTVNNIFNDSSVAQLLCNDKNNTELSFDEYNFQITKSPITNNNTTIATIIEWKDTTLQSSVINRLIDASQTGDFSIIETGDNDDADFIALSTNINQVLSTTGASINTAVNALKQVAEGNLDCKIEGNYKGLFNELKTHVNTTIE